MKRYFLIAVLFSVCCLQSFCQYFPEANRVDSVRLDSLRKILPLFRDSARVDLLNEITMRIVLLGSVPGAQKVDTVHAYASMAYEEAKKINYNAGMAMALLNLSGFEAFYNLPVTNIKAKEEDLETALRLAQGSRDDEVTAWAYYYLSSHAFTKNDFKTEEDRSKKSIYYFQKAGDHLRAAIISTWLCEGYSDRGEYENAFDYGKRSIELSKQSKKDFLNEYMEREYYSLLDMANLYSVAGDYENALNYVQRAPYSDGTLAIVSDYYCQMGKYDSALVYWNRWKNSPDGIGAGGGHKLCGYNMLANVYVHTREFDKAIEIYKMSINSLKYADPVHLPYFAINPLLGSAEAYNGKKIRDTALKYAREALGFAEKINQRPSMMKGYQLLSSVNHDLGKNDSAYEYLLKYNTIKDSIQNRQLLLRIYSYKKDAEDEKKQGQILLLGKDNKIKDAQLKQQSLIRNFLIACLLVLLIAGMFIYRTVALKRKNEKLEREKLESKLKVQQLENEKKQAELQQQATELEMQALRAQMNPHFIFNCLSSINRFILKNESKTASNYLTRFSRLIRMVLMNSQKPLVTLEEELQMLRLYLDMEQLRFKDSFDYVISFRNAMDAEAIFIPPLILQPFCENAIWHGLMHKEGYGHLTIDLSMQDNILHCTIADDGVGREKAAQLESRSGEKTGLPDGQGKSMGLEITTQRLALLSQDKNVQTFYTIEDIIDENKNIAGTRVILKIGYKKLMKEYA